MGKDFMDAVKGRRTHYGISKHSGITDEQIKKIIEEAVQYTPSAFNSQSARTVLLLGQQHDRLWDIVKESLRKVVPADQFKPTEEKIRSFAVGYGTILYFEEQEIVKKLQGEYPLYKDNFPIWSQQANGMLQLVVWTALEAEGLGVSLQHYNPLIDEEVRSEWNIPASWELVGQMPFGAPTAKPGEKAVMPLKDRVWVFQ